MAYVPVGSIPGEGLDMQFYTTFHCKDKAQTKWKKMNTNRDVVNYICTIMPILITSTIMLKSPYHKVTYNTKKFKCNKFKILWNQWRVIEGLLRFMVE